MTLFTLSIYIGILAILATLATYFYHKTRNILVSLLQYFCGFWFIVSGFVKAVDPLGTAFKMQDYFSQFQFSFKGSFLEFLSPLWPFFSEHAIWVSLFMILLEVMLGIMLVIGSNTKFTAWAFLLIMIFFTILTGFTYLTGYVPDGVNFFDFSHWGVYTASNMKVTDCGCFGDFIKLEPKVSFTKDLFLMIPAIIFLFTTRQFHRLFNPLINKTINSFSLIGLIIFCLYNTFWAEPIFDFRPFKNKTHVRELRAAEMESAANVPVTMLIKSKTDGKIIKLSQDEYMKRYKEFPKADFDITQEAGEPSIPKTKLSDFTLLSLNNEDVTDAFLDNPNYSLMIINYKVPYTTGTQSVEYKDTTYANSDSLIDRSNDISARKIVKITTRTENEIVKVWDTKWIAEYKEKIMPLIQSAEKEGIQTITVFAGMSSDEIQSVMKLTGLSSPVAEADDKLLKTIIRSNPGIILWKDGSIVKKWHIATDPTWKKIKKKMK
jgi:uncharacterized membrane protein YphA (DoxX/SURF4 family)